MNDIAQYAVVVKDNAIYNYSGVIKTFSEEYTTDNHEDAFKKYLEERQNNVNGIKEVTLYKKITTYIKVV